ncbi:MAG TPA: Gfo/Idh/MocA family oxidoreductase [Armatimonadota bacterium]|nr:Gfo/Idh/MocA family oxidoreductase [Armatimonadota bacterium]
MQAPIGCAVIGYGPMHNFGWAHSAWIEATPELRLVAVCDCDPARTAAAKDAFPHIRTYNDVAQVWEDREIQLVSIVTPHYTHCPLALQAFDAGKHVVVEKAMCLNVAEATAMVEASQRAGRMFAVHHNRRHDGNYRRIKEIVSSGAIGEVFHIELTAGSYSEFRHGWYSEKEKSGGAFYFWGPHAVDWVLDLVPQRITGVNGFFHKLVWHNISNEDQVRAIIRFEGGAVADVTWSHIAAIGKPLWRILGTKGAILDTGAGGNVGYEKQIHGPSGGSLTLVTVGEDGRKEEKVPYLESDWEQYWQDVADHLLRGGPVPVPGTVGRRVIGVFEAAERSSRTGQTEQVPYE